MDELQTLILNLDRSIASQLSEVESWMTIGEVLHG
jgi:hypothetical protein